MRRLMGRHNWGLFLARCHLLLHELGLVLFLKSSEHDQH